MEAMETGPGQNADLNGYEHLMKMNALLDLRMSTLESSINCKKDENEKLEKSLVLYKGNVESIQKEICFIEVREEKVKRNIDGFYMSKEMIHGMEMNLLSQNESMKENIKRNRTIQNQLLSKYNRYWEECMAIYNSLPWVSKRNKLQTYVGSLKIQLQIAKQKVQEHKDKIALFKKISGARLKVSIVSFAESYCLRDHLILKKRILSDLERHLVGEIEVLEKQKKDIIDLIKTSSRLVHEKEVSKKGSGSGGLSQKATSNNTRTPISVRLGLSQGVSLSCPPDLRREVLKPLPALIQATLPVTRKIHLPEQKSIEKPALQRIVKDPTENPHPHPPLSAPQLDLPKPPVVQRRVYAPPAAPSLQKPTSKKPPGAVLPAQLSAVPPSLKPTNTPTKKPSVTPTKRPTVAPVKKPSGQVIAERFLKGSQESLTPDSQRQVKRKVRFAGEGHQPTPSKKSREQKAEVEIRMLSKPQLSIRKISPASPDPMKLARNQSPPPEVEVSSQGPSLSECSQVASSFTVNLQVSPESLNLSPENANEKDKENSSDYFASPPFPLSPEPGQGPKEGGDQETKQCSYLFSPQDKQPSSSVNLDFDNFFNQPKEMKDNKPSSGFFNLFG